MTFSLSSQSQLKLALVHPDLIKVVEAAIQVSTIDFCVIEGIRTWDRQKALLAAGATTTMKSRHLTGHAVDLGAMVDGKLSWKPLLYNQIADAMLGQAAKLHIPITWGGSWKSFPDLDHFQCSWQYYPDHEESTIITKETT